MSRVGGIGAVVFSLACACALGQDGRAPRPDDAQHALDQSLRAATTHDARLAAVLAPRTDGFREDGAGFAGPATSAALSVTAPKSAREPLRVRVGHAGTAVSMTLRDAEPARGEIAGGRVVYHDVRVDTDRVIGTSSGAVEDALVLRSERAPHVFEYALDVAATARVEPDGSGGLSFRAERGDASLHVVQPYALDVQGTKRNAMLTWNDASRTMRVALDVTGLVFPVLVDPFLELGQWSEIALPRRPVRGGALGAYDVGHSQLVAYDALAHTATFDAAGWKLLAPPTAPPTTASLNAMTYDAVRNRVVLLVGDYYVDTAIIDTWLWDGTTWAKATTANAPMPREGGAFAFDAARGECVLFGGFSYSDVSGGYLSDTWTWNGTAWTQKFPAASPSPRERPAMTYDSVRQRVVLFGGADLFDNPDGGIVETLDDTWTWNGTTWTLQAGTRPPSRESASMAFDSTLGKAVLFSGYWSDTVGGYGWRGDTWTWNGAAWTQVAAPTSPSFRVNAVAAYDAVRHQVVVALGASGGAALADTWGFTGTTWTAIDRSPAPPPHAEHAMVFDSARGNTVLFGGRVGGDPYSGSGVTTNETWLWNGAAWALTAPATSPSPRRGPSLVNDSMRGRLVMFGGCSAGTYYADTWTWNGATWLAQSPATRPPARCNASMIYDSTRDRVVLFGGNDASGFRNDTWTYDGTNWTAVTLSTSPPTRQTGAFVFDAASNTGVLFGGESDAGADGNYLSDTWLWNGSVWLRGPTGPASSAAPVLAYDSKRRQSMLWLVSDSVGLVETWFWNANTWQFTSQSTPPSRAHAAMTFDAARDEMLAFGGDARDTSQLLDDLWRYAYPGMACSLSRDCPASFTCVDGACCSVPSCGTCETCNGFSPGRCTIVANHEDDTCTAASGKSCDARGACKAKDGTPASNPAECASGIIADGVCCNTACNGPCQACSSERKASGSRPGVCDVAASGVDSRGACATTARELCGTDGTCDGHGGCRSYPAATACGPVACVDNRATGRVCDGRGACTTSAEGLACGLYACRENQGCTSRCSSDADCGERSHCANGRCVANEGPKCENNVLVDPDGMRTGCGAYACVGSACKTSCASIVDCAQGAACGFNGQCVADDASNNDNGGGCALAASRAASDRDRNAGLGAAGIGMLGAAMARRSRTRQRTRGSARVGACIALVLVSLLAWAGCRSARVDGTRDTRDVGATATRLARHDERLAGLLAPRDAAFTRDAAFYVSEGWRDAANGRINGLGVRASERAQGALAVGVARFDALRIGLTLMGANDVAAQLEQGRVVYTNALRDTDRVVASNGSSVEDALLLNSAQSPAEYTYRVEIGAGLRAEWRDGMLAFVDETGRAALSVARPYALDAAGTQRSLRMDWNAARSELKLSLDSDGLAYPVLVDPTIDLGTWAEAATDSHLARSGGAVAFDAARGRAVLFGGTAANTVLGDTWLWDGVSWQQVFPPVSPSPRTGHALAYDAMRARVVMYGSADFTQPIGETWTWDGATWAQATPATSPDTRRSPAMAYDPLRDRIVLFGGYGGATGDYLAETWTWDGATWTKRTPATSPPPRFQAGFAFDAARGNTVLFGGYGGAPGLADTWTWDGSNWTKKTPATSPPARYDMGMAYDGARARVVTFGGLAPASSTNLGDTWTWDGTTWAQSLPATSPGAASSTPLVYDSARSECILGGGAATTTSRWNGTTWNVPAPTVPTWRGGVAMAYDAARQRTVIFGGTTPTASAETWLWDGVRWSLATPATSPPARAYAGMAYDAARANIVLNGGANGNVRLGDTWTWDGTTWTQRVVSSPGLRMAHALAYDAARARVVLFGGINQPNYLNDTWTQRSVASPGLRMSHALAYDAARSRVVLFGGINQPTYLNDTWTWDGASWTLLNPTRRPAARRGLTLAYHAGTQRIVMYGTSDPGQTYARETWLWDGGNWTQAMPASSPPALYGARAALDTSRGDALLTTGGDTWRWDGSNWFRMPIAAAPPPRGFGGLAYDEKRDQLVLFGGEGIGPGRNDTWLFSVPGNRCATDSDCASGHCVDRVCCNVAACGTCETCAGLSVGECTPVTNADDDSCGAAAGKSCDAHGACRAALGTPAADPATCASGIIADGVCCDQTCGGCMACTADKKESGTLSGVCDFARAGTDPHDQCEAAPRETCQRDGQCDGRGACRLQLPNTACGAVTCVDNRSTSLVCDGAGTCSASPVGVACGLYACRTADGCPTRCTSDADCSSRSHCDMASAACVPNVGTTCDGNAVVDPANNRTECGAYVCRDAQCLTACTRVTDCANGASCDFLGRCVQATNGDGDSGGCSVDGRSFSTSRASGALVTFLAMLAIVGRRGKRRVSD